MYASYRRKASESGPGHHGGAADLDDCGCMQSDYLFQDCVQPVKNITNTSCVYLEHTRKDFQM